MAEIAVWFQHRLELMAIDRSLYCHLSRDGSLTLALSGKRKMVDLPIVYGVASTRILVTLPFRARR